MKKHFPLVAIALIFAASLVSWNCGKSDSSGAASAVSNISEPPKGDAVSEKPAPDGDEQTIRGTFQSLDMGDYMHFNMLDEAGEELSFFVMEVPADEIAPFEQGGMEGKSVEVKWRKVTRDIPEAGGEMEIEELTSVKVLE